MQTSTQAATTIQRIALAAAITAAGLAALLGAMVLVSIASRSHIDSVAVEAPASMVGFFLLPCASAVALVTSAIANRWSPSRISRVALVLSTFSLGGWLLFLGYVFG
jgi:hypothetical protein